jgi:hypothetical protein
MTRFQPHRRVPCCYQVIVKKQNKIITDQMIFITNLLRDLKKLSQFRKARWERRRMPHDEYIMWIYEQAREL